MSGGAQFFKRRSTETGAAIRDTDQEQAGTVVQKIRSSIRGSLLLYHNSSSTTASNHIMPQNISSIEDIASAALFTSQGEQNGKPYPTHVLPSPITINKEAWQRAAHGALSSQLRSQQRSVASGEEINWITDAADCLPYRTVQTTAVMA